MKKYLAIAGLLAAGAAIAQQPAPAPVAPAAPPAHDRVTTRAETVAKVREHFGEMDANKDGALTTDEAMKGRGRFADKVKRFETRDPNAAFDRMDANKDGSISRDEFAKAREERIEKRMVRREERKEARADGRRHAFRMHRMGGRHMIVMADTDKDGRITLGEAEALALQRFDQMDSNKDGQVTPEERREGRRIIIERRIEEKKGDS